MHHCEPPKVAPSTVPPDAAIASCQSRDDQGATPSAGSDGLGDTPHCLAVMYHYVHNAHAAQEHRVKGHQGPIGLDVDQFEQQLDELTRRCEPVDWPSLFAWTQGTRSLPRRCFLLTFDDGLLDHARTVVPILDRRGLRGTFFIPGAILSDQRMLTAHALHLLLSAMSEADLTSAVLACLGEHEPNTNWRALMDDLDGTALYHYETPQRARLKHLINVTLPSPLRKSVVDALFTQHVGSLTRWQKHWYLGWDDLMAMQSGGHTIGGHGHEHEPLGRLTPSRQRKDIHRVGALLREGLGTDLRPFSFPFGSFDDSARGACLETGFVHAFTTRAQWITQGCDATALPRVDTILVDATLREDATCPLS